MDTKPSLIIRRVISDADLYESDGMAAMMTRVSEFRDPTEAALTGIALDERARTLTERRLDEFWADQRQANVLDVPDLSERELIIGSGYHAAVYAATRVLSGFPRPVVVERSSRVGGTFAMTERPTFYLNSRNRPGPGGLAGDNGTSLNYIPGAPIQPANVSMCEYQTNTDMAFAIRLTLAQYANVVTNAEVTEVSLANDDFRTEVTLGGERDITVRRVIDATGLGDPSVSTNGTSILSFVQFMQRMGGMWPLRGLKRVAVIGGGDSGKCAVESLLGLSPQPLMAAPVLDYVDRIDWYAPNLPDSCEEWREDIRGRYQAIGRYLRPDRFGVKRLNVYQRRVTPVSVPFGALIGSRSYDLVVQCVGNSLNESILGLQNRTFDQYYSVSGEPIARQSYLNTNVFKVGPAANLSFSSSEREAGITDIDANRVAMFRTGPKTAELAAVLPK